MFVASALATGENLRRLEQAAVVFYLRTLVQRIEPDQPHPWLIAGRRESRCVRGEIAA